MDQTANKAKAKASADVSKALVKFADARSNGRRFHAESLGKDVDPNHSFGDFLWCVAHKDDKALEKRYGSYIPKAALSATGSAQTGGYLVPAELRDDLMGDVADEAIFRGISPTTGKPRATIIPMTTMTLKLPYWDAVTAQSKGSAPFWGGMQFLWTEEAATLAEDEPNFRSLTLKAWELGGVLKVSGPMMEDAKGLEAWLRRAFARSLAWYEDYAFISGSGAGQSSPLGVINAPGAIVTTRTTAGQYKVNDGQNLYGSLYSPREDSAACWLLSFTVKSSLISSTSWFINGPMQQYGLPIYWTTKQPPLGTKGDAILVDPSFYIIGDRQALTIDASPYAGTTGTSTNVFFQNQWMWRVVERVDGQPLLSSPITIPDGAGTPNTVSPIVVLAT